MKGARKPLPPGVLPAWTHVHGRGVSRVVVYEDLARERTLTLRWWPVGGTNWKRKSLGRTLERDRHGVVTRASEQWAKDQATVKSAALIAGTPEAATVLPQRFTIGQTEALLTNQETGPYPHRTPFRDELTRALDFAATVWGSSTPWSTITDADWTKLMRRRLSGLMAREKQGIRSTELTVSRLNTAGEWLREHKHIPRDAALLSKKWRAQLLDYWRGETAKLEGRKPDEVQDPTPNRPRHTLDAMRKILAAAPLVDPRFHLLVQLAAEYRLGQARRAKRSHLNDEAGTFTIHGRGKKGGAVVDLTDGQRAVWAAAIGDGGYLAAAEAAWKAKGTDYFLFPAGKMAGRKVGAWTVGAGIDLRKPVSREWIIKSFHEAERHAKVPGIKGGAAYTLRRQNVDAMNELGISPLGKQAAGGWSSTKVPDSIYAESTNKAGRAEAKRVRAQTRGEA